MKPFTLSIAAGTRGKGMNTLYATHAHIQSLDDLVQAALFDHVAGTFTNNRRGNNNFIQADVIMMDCDNCHTDNSAEWLTPAKLAERLPGVEFAVIYSKSNMKDKKDNGKVITARPRWHVYFALSEPVTSAARIRELKECLLAIVSEFDNAAKDAARFFYGVEVPKGEVHEDTLCVDEFFLINGIEPPAKPKQAEAESKAETDAEHEQLENSSLDLPDVITPGNRHNKLFDIGFNALIKYSEEKARELFYKAAEKCEPPKPVDEVNRLWQYLVTKRNEFKAKYAEKKHTLTLGIIEQTLKELNITVRFDVIRKVLEVSDLPADSAHLPEAYNGLNACAKQQANSELLPLFLESYFKDKQFRFNKDFLINGIAAIANTHRYNPVLDMLNSTHADETDRITKLCEVLGIKENSYYCTFLRKWLLQALSLAFNDDGAITPEFVLVLQGRQGCGKTSFFRKLAFKPELFKEGAVIDMRNKDTIIEGTSTWLCELGELDSTLKREQASLKSFLTSNYDTYRRPYARIFEKIERRTVFAATVNPEQVNRDTTGSRRFVYIHVDAIDKQFILDGMTPEWTAQLWRQVYEELYLKLGRYGFYLTDDERAYAEKNNEAFNVPLTAETELLDYIDWQECFNIDTDGTPCKVFQWYKASEVKDMLKLTRYSAQAIGEALTALCKRYPHTDSKRSNGRTRYLLPPVPDLRDE